MIDRGGALRCFGFGAPCAGVYVVAYCYQFKQAAAAVVNIVVFRWRGKEPII